MCHTAASSRKIQCLASMIYFCFYLVYLFFIREHTGRQGWVGFAITPPFPTPSRS